ncbi:hypothetical protein CUR178_03866 [Leishmania enriettii]|uniref:Pseudouridine synthase RsuA/RluA-like domain-containing protein n=1 Tax=Leishmania enriettii TaxID=5663 RepID=A0A836KSK4_LEIEN|nr:hypothetical protein CUR178_03866 [Leishmania enriettii]
MPSPQRPCTIAELQRLEEEAWMSPAKRALYATRHIPGFPWHTVQEVTSPDKPATANAVALFTRGVRRHVIPYDFPFTVFVKGRWIGRRLLEVYAEELPHHSPAYYQACLRQGRLYCVQRGALGQHNTQRRLLKRSAATSASVDLAEDFSDGALDRSPPLRTSPTTTNTAASGLRQHLRGNCQAASPASPPSRGEDVVLQHGDVVYHTVHRHEVPVTVGMSGVDAVLLTAVRIARYGLICVDKPTGLPTHATGRYYYNSLTSLLEYVLAPKRVAAWLLDEDPLLQSLVSTEHLSAAEKSELYAYYAPSRAPVESAESVFHPSRCQLNGERGTKHRSQSSQHSCAAATEAIDAGGADLEEVDPNKVPRPCHRLDKVTSGVLLMAVRQDAAKRIGSVLMKKAKEVEEAVTTELSRREAESAALRDRRCETPVTRIGDQMAIPDDKGGEVTLPAICTPPLTSSPPPASLQRILGSTYALQKYYLARVRVDSARVRPVSGATSEVETERQYGPQPPPSLHLWCVSGKEPCLRKHTAYLSRILSSASGVRDIASLRARRPIKGSVALRGVFPDGVLTTVPVPASGALMSASAAAATLCQCLSALPTVAAPAHQQSLPLAERRFADGAEEALVLCTPYTGRLHQIRKHLSSLGCPIVGDIVYARTSGNVEVPERPSRQAQPQLSREKLGGTESITSDRAALFTKDAAARDVDASGDCAAQRSGDACAFVFFDATQLPAAYHRFCEAMKTAAGDVEAASRAHQISPPSKAEERAVTADADGGIPTKKSVKRLRAEGSIGGVEVEIKQGIAALEGEDVPLASPSSVAVAAGAGTAEEERGSASITGWQNEPLCYECAGRLPIIAAGECATGTSAICLHAWVYRVREDLLLATDGGALSRANSPASALGASAMLTTTNPSSPAPQPSAFPEDGESGAPVRDRAAQCSSSHYRLVVEDKFVCFEAPPPVWLRW